MPPNPREHVIPRAQCPCWTDEVLRSLADEDNPVSARRLAQLFEEAGLRMLAAAWWRHAAQPDTATAAGHLDTIVV